MGRTLRISRWRKLAFTVALLVFTYLVFETVATSRHMLFEYEQPRSIWVVKKPDQGRIFHFDPIRGYWLSPIGAKVACFEDRGFVEFDSFRGNNHGFPDRDDFTVERLNPKTTRIAVLGDSFSAAQFLNMNWPDRAEDLAGQRGLDIQLLNFSIDGGGLANWWSVLTRFIERENFHLDGIIFAVFEDDLKRKFHWRDDGFDAAEGDDIQVLMGRSSAWDPTTYPKRPDVWSAKSIHRVVILQPQEFRQVITEKQPPTIRRPFRLFILSQASRHLRYFFRPRPSLEIKSPAGKTLRTRDDLVSDMRRYLKARSLPAMVVYVPHDLEKGSGVMDARRFASALKARVIDGSAPFREGGPESLAELTIGPDGHWSQKGSDMFAKYMVEVLKEWP